MFERVTHLSAPALLVVVLALSLSGPAYASPQAVVRDCADDGFVETDKYSRSELRRGRDQIPADLDAYSDCRAQINDALARRNGPGARTAGNNPDGFPGGDGVGGSDGSGGGGGSGNGDASGVGSGEPLTEQERQEQAAATERKRQMARADTESLLGDRGVNPGVAGAFDRADTANGLSLPVLLALIALTLLLAAGALMAVRRRNPEFLAGTLGRVPFPRGLGSLPFRRRR